MRVSSATFSCILFSVATNAFVVTNTNGVSSWNHRQNTRLLEGTDTKDTEKLVREELKERNTIIDKEEQYAVVDGEGFGTIPEDTETTTTTSIDRKSWEARLKKMTKKRAYPLFLAEKAAEIGEKILSDIFDAPKYPIGSEKEKIVVLGTGWGAASFLKDVDANFYDVTIVSPRNYFLFTPMLAGASVGTVEFRSITEPVREINRKATYLEGIATGIDPKTKTLSCESVTCNGNSCEITDFSVEYDRLVITVGAQTNTFGIPGVREYCNFLKQIEDARRIRTAIVNCFERANLPGLTDEDRIRDLTFAVIGAGPTGIEFAAELRDFIEQDGPKYYPKLLKFVRIKVIEASSTILAPFDKSLQDEAITQMNRRVQVNDEITSSMLPSGFKLVELLLDSSVKEVTEKTIHLNDGSSIDYGVAVWAAGNGPLPFTLDVIEQLGEAQAAHQGTARGRIATDPWLRADGSEGSILAFGDCSCVIDGPDGFLPATAQVASQQGEYLAYLLNDEFEISPPISDDGVFLPPRKNPESDGKLSEAIASFSTNGGEYAKPFQFLNLGILAYTGGGSALAQVSTLPSAPPIKGRGKIGNALWRSVYLSKQISVRNRVLVINDWINRQIFGRDITRL
ncbi:unnamed protein product [Cylindrotheca closterium]|uniref:NADH:ubiquinone reductase (non-electrogenic) n=1 Tax=Cylindrotheca closterium TaxID=2856 RepID=A0AAD2FCM8_9STRA|nr:unnamed protein product [Cylindrotheca closterium]